MAGRQWRAWWVACSLLAAMFLVAAAVTFERERTPGAIGTLLWTLGPRDGDGIRTIERLDASSPAALAGARAGDRSGSTTPATACGACGPATTSA